VTDVYMYLVSEMFSQCLTMNLASITTLSVWWCIQNRCSKNQKKTRWL